jgi:hypothetical protein
MLFVVFTGFLCRAQEYRPFRVSIGGGYAAASGYLSGGIFGTLEPAYRISDRITLGLRGEIAAIARGDYEGLSVDVDLSRINSLTANGIYYFESVFVRPFAGFGVGEYRLSSVEYKIGTSGPTQGTGKETKFGMYPRIGIEVGHLAFSIDYNIVAKTKLPEGAEFKNNYVALRLSVFFGGGKIRGKTKG